ncbi:MAG: serine/threonine-protein kinase [Candidatus Falkowbacteria bacterium]
MERKIALKLLTGRDKNREASLDLIRQNLEFLPWTAAEKKNAMVLAAKAHLACFDGDGRALVPAIRYLESLEDWAGLRTTAAIAKIYGHGPGFKAIREIEERRQISLLCEQDRGVEPTEYSYEETGEDVNRSFREYCRDHGKIILKRLQTGAKEADFKSFVYLVRDSDGIIKVFKELVDYKLGPAGKYIENEDEIIGVLPRLDWLPRYYGIEKIAPDLDFIRQSFVYGSVLDEFRIPGHQLDKDAVISLIADLAKKLKILSDAGILYTDLKGGNVIVGDNGANIIDFGLAKILTPGEREVFSVITEPRYSPPETTVRRMFSLKSIVFQLGVLAYELLFGAHPLSLDCLLDDPENRENEYLKYAWANACLPLKSDPAVKTGDARLEIIGRMLRKDPEKRPDLEAVAERLGTKKTHRIKPVSGRDRTGNKNTILFPARMGIPHKGHIEYIARLLRLGYFVKISLQRSYTITARDPLPKWLVMKMVARSLFDRGFGPNDFEFILTPFYRTDQEHRLHFAMIPGADDIVAIASGNPGVHGLFPRHLILDQKALFGEEEKEYDIRSWGEIIRAAVRDNDYETFRAYAAVGVEAILSFDEIRSMYGRPAIEFVPGTVSLVLEDENGAVVASGGIFRYLTPEESLVRHLKRADYGSRLVDIYARLTVININGRDRSIKYLKTVFDGTNETIYFRYA